MNGNNFIYHYKLESIYYDEKCMQKLKVIVAYFHKPQCHSNTTNTTIEIALMKALNEIICTLISFAGKSIIDIE